MQGMSPDITTQNLSGTNRNQQQIYLDRLQRALEAGGLAVWEVNVDTLILHRTAPTVPPGSRLGADMHLSAFLAMIDEEFREIVSTAIDQAMKQAQATEALYRITRPDDQLRWIEAHIYPALSATGDVLRLLIITRDITNIRQAEIERESLLQEMATARQAAERSVRQRDAFITSTVHDLRTPLTYIRGRTQLLQRRLARSTVPDEDRTWIDDGLNQIVSGVGQMTDLLVDLQDVIFLQLGRPLELHPVPVELVDYARGIVLEFEQQFSGHHFTFAADAPSLQLEIDPVRIRRVISNLLMNAVKYSDVDTTIQIRIDSTPDWVTLAVTDEGMGIPDADLTRIFDRFHRGSNVASHQAGSGIGLAGARVITRQHGGDLQVTSTLGAGSTFSVRLPRNRPRPQPESVPLE
jgi:signal transduction histidine kinase